MTLTILRLKAFLLCFLAAVAACDDNTPICAEEETKSCYCSTGDRGNRLCDDDGLDFGDCQCPDAGVSDGSASNSD